MNRMFDWLRRGRAGDGEAAPEPMSLQGKSGYPLIAFQGLGEANWSPSGAGALVNEGFMRNPVVYRCVRMIGEAAASLPMLLYEGEAELAAHPLLNLLGAPNPHQSGQGFMEALYAHLLVSGNAYVQPV